MQAELWLEFELYKSHENFDPYCDFLIWKLNLKMVRDMH